MEAAWVGEEDDAKSAEPDDDRRRGIRYLCWCRRAVFGDVGKALVVAVGTLVFLVGGVVLAVRERKGRGGIGTWDQE